MTKTERSRAQAAAPRWSTQDSAVTYGVDGWSQGYFGINKKGHVVVRPERRPGRTIDLYEVVEGLAERGIDTPVLLRFHDILGSRLRVLHEAFAAAIEENDFRGSYACVYPIKVNQQRHVVENIHSMGGGLGFGLEAGSKPELLAVLGLTSGHSDVPIVCNGFKDSEFIETVVLAAKLGRNIIPIVEKYSELELLVRHAERYEVRPTIGVRVKLSARATGRWEDSSGLRSKFGLYVSEILDALEFLKTKGMAECLQLLHCHLGSQVSDIRSVKNAMRSARRPVASWRTTVTDSRSAAGLRPSVSARRSTAITDSAIHPSAAVAVEPANVSDNRAAISQPDGIFPRVIPQTSLRYEQQDNRRTEVGARFSSFSYNEN